MAASPSAPHRKPAPSKLRSLVWFTSRSVARQLRELDCSVIAIFADIARDKKIDPGLRFRAAERLATLLYGARPNERATATRPAPLDLGAIISGGPDGEPHAAVPGARGTPSRDAEDAA